MEPNDGNSMSTSTSVYSLFTEYLRLKVRSDLFQLWTDDYPNTLYVIHTLIISNLNICRIKVRLRCIHNGTIFYIGHADNQYVCVDVSATIKATVVLLAYQCHIYSIFSKQLNTPLSCVALPYLVSLCLGFLFFVFHNFSKIHIVMPHCEYINIPTRTRLNQCC